MRITDRKEETHMAAALVWSVIYMILVVTAGFGEWLVEVAKRRKAASRRKKRQKLKRKRWSSA